MRTGLGEQTQGLRGAAAATILDDSRWTPVLRSEAIGSAAYELGQLDGSARLARWFSWPGGGSGASDGGAGRSFTQDAQGLPADPRGPLLTAWVPLGSTGSVGMFDVAPASHTDMQGAFWSTQPSTPGGGQQAGFDPYSEQPIASRYGITRGVGSGMEPGDVLFTAGWLLRSRVDELAVAAIGLSVVGVAVGPTVGLPDGLVVGLVLGPCVGLDGGLCVVGVSVGPAVGETVGCDVQVPQRIGHILLMAVPNSESLQSGAVCPAQFERSCS